MKPFGWWRQYWLAKLLIKIFPKTIKLIVNEAVTEAIHPDFGYVWQEHRCNAEMEKGVPA